MIRHLGMLLVLALLAPFANAAQVVKVKDTSVLVNLQGTPAAVGDNFFVVENGKKKALIKIAKIKGDKAIAKLLKGTAGPGMTLAPGPSGGGPTANSGGPSKHGGGGKKTSDSRQAYGFMLGYAMDTMSVNVNSATASNVSLGTVALSGSGFSGKGLFDYEIFPQVWFRGLAGLEMFNAAGESKCGTGNKEACDAKIMYLSADFVGRYVFSEGTFRPWLGLGIGLLFPASKSSTALNSSSIGTTNVITPQLGFDMYTSPTMYIPVSVEYGMLPKSDEVDAHWIALRAGVAFPF